MTKKRILLFLLALSIIGLFSVMFFMPFGSANAISGLFLTLTTAFLVDSYLKDGIIFA